MKKAREHGKDEGLNRFAEQALRALRRAARSARAENRRFGLPILVWEDGRIISVPS